MAKISLAALGFMASAFARHTAEEEYFLACDMAGTKPKQKVIHAGHRKFVIDGVEVWALNEKNAKKKAKKINTNQ